jgi:hypothetical protein
MYENRVLREIFGPMREEVKGDWRKLHSEKLISLPDVCVIKSRRRGWVGHVARMGGGHAYRVLVGKPEGKRQHGRPWRRWEDITMHVKEIVREGLDWIELAQDRDKWWAVVNTVMNDLYFCTVHVVTFTLFKTNSYTSFKHTFTSTF